MHHGGPYLDFQMLMLLCKHASGVVRSMPWMQWGDLFPPLWSIFSGLHTCNEAAILQVTLAAKFLWLCDRIYCAYIYTEQYLHCWIASPICECTLASIYACDSSREHNTTSIVRCNVGVWASCLHFSLIPTHAAWERG